MHQLSSLAGTKSSYKSVFLDIPYKRVTNYLSLKMLFMKKYLFGIIAATIAIFSAAYKAPKHTNGTFATTYTFHYVPTTYTQPMVEDESNWTSGSAGNCDGTPHKACEIEVIDSYTHLDNNNNRVLNTTGSFVPSIAAQLGTGVSTYVVDQASSVGVDSNTDKN